MLCYICFDMVGTTVKMELCTHLRENISNLCVRTWVMCQIKLCFTSVVSTGSGIYPIQL